jgi:hypothetical protein
LEDLTEHECYNDTLIQAQIVNGDYDAVIYGKMGIHDGSLPNLPFWELVKKHAKQIAFLYGGDSANSRNSEHVTRHAAYGTCFVRELY